MKPSIPPKRGGVAFFTGRLPKPSGKIQTIQTVRSQAEGTLKESEALTSHPQLARQESLVIPNQKALQEHLNFFNPSTQKLNLFEKLVPDSMLGRKTLSPFWSEYTQVISHTLSALTPIESSDLENHVLSGYATLTDANSWFSMNVTPVKKGNSLKISWASSLAFLLGYTGAEPENQPKKRFKKTPRNSTTKTPPNAVKKIRLYPGNGLHQLGKQWLAAYRWIYNGTIVESL